MHIRGEAMKDIDNTNATPKATAELTGLAKMFSRVKDAIMIAFQGMDGIEGMLTFATVAPLATEILKDPVAKKILTAEIFDAAELTKYEEFQSKLDMIDIKSSILV